MGVPYMRAVLRAILAERRSDRPTAMENFDGLFFLPLCFMIVAPTGAAYHGSYHILSTHLLKENRSSESSSSYVRSGATRRRRGQGDHLVSREPRCDEARASATKDRDRLSQRGNRPPSSALDDSNRPNRSRCFQKQSLRGLWRDGQARGARGARPPKPPVPVLEAIVHRQSDQHSQSGRRERFGVSNPARK